MICENQLPLINKNRNNISQLKFQLQHKEKINKFIFKYYITKELESFGYTVHGEGVCLQEQEELVVKLTNNLKVFNVTSDTFIYSNYEQTLSFLIQVTLQLKQNISKESFFSI